MSRLGLGTATAAGGRGGGGGGACVGGGGNTGGEGTNIGVLKSLALTDGRGGAAAIGTGGAAAEAVTCCHGGTPLCDGRLGTDESAWRGSR